MRVEIVSRQGCPHVATLEARLEESADALRTDIGIVRSEPAGDLSLCPALLIEGKPVCLCGTPEPSQSCGQCGSRPFLPDAEILRWHLAHAAGRKTVLFLCSGNAARSQMAEGLVNHFLGAKWAAFSAGFMPMTVWEPVVKALDEIGVTFADRKTKHVELFLGCSFDRVVSLCSDADAFCTAFPDQSAKDHIPFDDPMTNSFFGIGDMQRSRLLRDEMRSRLLPHLEDRS